MKIFTSAQIHELDKYTIEHEPISSIDLMERAAKALTVAVMAEWSTATPIVVFAGPGNNGGDALAMARMLVEQSYNVTAYLFNISGHLSEDCAANKARLIEKRAKALIEVKEELPVPEKKSRRDKRSSLTVSPEVRRQIRLLSLWAAHKGVIKEETAEALLRSMIQSFLKKHTEAQAFLNEMS